MCSQKQINPHYFRKKTYFRKKDSQQEAIKYLSKIRAVEKKGPGM